MPRPKPELYWEPGFPCDHPALDRIASALMRGRRFHRVERDPGGENVEFVDGLDGQLYEVVVRPLFQVEPD